MLIKTSILPSFTASKCSEQEKQQLYGGYRRRSGRAIAPCSRDRAPIGWDCVPDEILTLPALRPVTTNLT